MSSSSIDYKNRLFQALAKNDVYKLITILNIEGFPNDSPWWDYELLLRAMKYENYFMISILIEINCRVNKTKCYTANSPLHLASGKMRNLSIVRMLLDKGADIDDKNRNGNTPIHLAFLSQADDIVHELMKERLLIGYEMKNKMNSFGLTYLHIACTRSDLLDVIEKLIEADADVNCQMNFQVNYLFAGYTPLHFAVEQGKREVIEVLLTYGADMYIQNSNGSTPLHIACEKRDSDIIDLLLAYDEKKQNVVNSYGLSHFMVATCSSDVTIVEDYLRHIDNHLITSLVNISIPMKSCNDFYPFSGYTPLHFASEYGNTKICELLLDLGSNCCVKNNNGLTALDLTQMFGYVETWNLLLVRCGCYDMFRENSLVEVMLEEEKIKEINENSDVDYARNVRI